MLPEWSAVKANAAQNNFSEEEMEILKDRYMERLMQSPEWGELNPTAQALKGQEVLGSESWSSKAFSGLASNANFLKMNVPDRHEKFNEIAKMSQPFQDADPDMRRQFREKVVWAPGANESTETEFVTSADSSSRALWKMMAGLGPGPEEAAKGLYGMTIAGMSSVPTAIATWMDAVDGVPGTKWSLTEKLYEIGEDIAQEANRIPEAAEPTFSGAEGLDEKALWAAYQAGNLLPTVLGIGASAGIGGAVGGALGGALVVSAQVLRFRLDSSHKTSKRRQANVRLVSLLLWASLPV